ncbi:MAG: hypothetical protein VXX73_05950 [Pseudomonadota bacterium]|nr:hypothetical protein [Pseudomonadota bacterium]
MPKTIVLNDYTTCTGSVFCDVKEIRENFKSQSEQLIKAFDLAKSKLNIQSNIKLHFRNIRQKKGKTTLGQFYNNTKTVEIDCKNFDLKSKVNTIIHELVHAQQYEQKRLSLKGKMYKFEGEQFEQPKNHDEYYNLPWEVEAREIAKKHTNSIMKAIS